MKLGDFFHGIKISKEKKEKALIGFLLGIFFLLIATPSGTFSGSKKDNTNDVAKDYTQENQITETKDSNSYAYICELENKLEKTISGMEGVGEVKVMITLKNTGEKQLEKNLVYESEIETSLEEGKEIEKNVVKNNPETVLIEADGDTLPVVISETYPDIEGVLVVCQGGDDTEVVLHIKEAVQALFSIDTHKIVVCKAQSD